MKLNAPAKWLLYRWLARRRRVSGQPCRPVGIYKADRLGDFVLASGAIQRIVEQEGAENCLLILAPYARELARRQFPELEQAIVEPWHSGLGPMLRYLKEHAEEPLFRQGVGRLVCLRHNRLFQENVVCGSIPANETWGAATGEPSREPGQWLASLPFDHIYRDFLELPGEPRDLVRHRTVLGGFLGAKLDPVDVIPKMEWHGTVGEPFVAVSPFGSATIRDFPPELLAAAGRRLWRDHGLPLRLLSPPGDEQRYQRLLNELVAKGVPQVSVRTCGSLNGLIDAVAASRLVLSVETATAHLAGALDRPLVALLGGGHFGWFAPWQRSARQRWISNPVPCYGCNWVCTQSEPKCLTQISAQPVEEAVDQALGASVR
jgi:ADP-heptose:LPS heptosyltransferase